MGDLLLNKIYNSDGILRGLDKIPDNSIDLLLTDPPYNISRTLNCKGQKLGSTAKLDFDYGSWDEQDVNNPEKLHQWAYTALKKVKGWAVIFCAKQDIGNYW